MSDLVINFDDLNPKGSHIKRGVIPNGYAGFDWSKLDFFTDTSMKRYESLPGFHTGDTSGHGIATVGPGDQAAATISMDGTFTFKSVEVTAVNEPQSVWINEYRHGTYLGMEEIYVNSSAPTLFQPKWSDIDKITIAVGDGEGDGIVLDDLTVSHVKAASTAVVHEQIFAGLHLDTHPAFTPLQGTEHIAIA